MNLHYTRISRKVQLSQTPHNSLTIKELAIMPPARYHTWKVFVWEGLPYTRIVNPLWTETPWTDSPTIKAQIMPPSG